MKKIERVGFVIKPHAPDVEKILAELIQYLEKKKMECLLEDEAAQKLKKGKGMPITGAKPIVIAILTA